MIAIHHFYQQWHGFTGKKVFLQRSSQDFNKWLQFEYICIIYVNIFTKYITYDQDVPPCVGCKSSKSPEKEQKENKLQSIIDNHLVNYKPQKIQFIGCGCVYLRVDWEKVYKEKQTPLHLVSLTAFFGMSNTEGLWIQNGCEGDYPAPLKYIFCQKKQYFIARQQNEITININFCHFDGFLIFFGKSMGGGYVTQGQGK